MKAVLASAAFLLLSCVTPRLSKPAASTNPKWTEECERGKTAYCALLKFPAGLAHPVSILQGVTSNSATGFSAVVPTSSQLEYWLVQDAGTHDVLTIQSHQAPESSEWRVDQIFAANLKPNVVYQLWVIENGRLWDRRWFTTLEPQGKPLHFSVISCMDDAFWVEQSKAWQKVRETGSQVLFLLGDNVYGNKYVKVEGQLTPIQLWNRYIVMRNTLDLYRWSHLVPTVATWDDHDFGANDGDRTFAYKEASRAIFHAFFPQAQSQAGWESGPGVAGVFRIGQQTFVLLDDRSFRSPNKVIANDQTQFGEDQEKWLFELLKSTHSPIWLMNGGQFFGGYHAFESYEGSHPQSFASFQKRLKSLRRTLVLVSGDRHMTEIMKLTKKDIGVETYELTSSGIHAKTYPDAVKLNPNPRRIEARSGPMNFMEISSESNGLALRFLVKAWDIDGDLLFQRQLSVGGKLRK